MKLIRYPNLMLCLILLISCKNDSQKQASENTGIPVEESTSSLPVLNASTRSKGSTQSFLWNDLSNNIEFIALETNDKSLLTESIRLAYLDDDFIIIVDNRSGSIVVFDGKGKFRTTIKSVGNGPGDYVFLTYVTFDKSTSTIFVYDNGNRKIILYDLEGNFKESFSTADKIDGNVLLLKDNRLIIKNNEGKYQVTVMDLDFNIMVEYLPYDPIFTERDKTMIFLSSRGSTSLKDAILLNNVFNDTIYSFSINSCDPIAVWDKRNGKMGKQDIGNFMQLMTDSHKNEYIIPRNIEIFSHFLLIRYVQAGDFITTLWDFKNDKVVAEYRNVALGGKKEDVITGFPYKLESGESFNILPAYITENKLAFFISAENMTRIFSSYDEDDNPTVMVMEVK